MLIRFIFLSYLISTLIIGEAHSETKILSTNDKEAISIYQTAESSIKKKKYDQALDTLEIAQKRYPKFLEIYVLKATMYHRLGQFDKCKHELRYIEKKFLKKAHYNIIYQVSYLYYRCGEYKRSAKVLSTILKKPSWMAFVMKQHPPIRMKNKIMDFPIKVLRKKKYIELELKEKIDSLFINLKFCLKLIKNPLSFRPISLKPLNTFSAQYFPVLSVDQQKIYFTARKGHKISDQEDIYYSVRDKKGKWKEPISISQNINTNNNEGACTLSSDGNTIIFSAYNRPENFGTCDLYVSYRKGDTWTKPENMGPNINTEGWQSQPSLSANGKYLFFSSKRAGNWGKKDIWMSIKKNGQWSKAINLGPNINKKGREISPFIHPNGKTLFFASDSEPSLGGLDIYYTILENGQWTEPVNLGFPINNHKDQVSLFITADGNKGYYAAGTQKGVYYNGKLYEFKIPKSLIPYPRCGYIYGTVILEKYNLDSNPQVAVYELSTNRELEKVEVDMVNKNYCITLEEGKRYQVVYQAKNHLPETVIIDLTKLEKFKNNRQNIKLDLIKKSKKKYFKHIYFDFNKSILNPKGIDELKIFAKFLHNYPKMKILLEGYTDNIGSDQYNLALSEKRAQAVYDFLIKTNIKPNRLQWKGNGKLNPDLNDQEDDERKLARRVSFKIIDY